MRYALIGYGRMGREIEIQAGRRGHELAGVVEPDAGVGAGKPRIPLDSLTGVDLAFEFTRPEAAESNVLAAVQRGVPVVCGTTGWSPSRRLREATRDSGHGVLIAPNFSVGMNLFYRLVAVAARQFAAADLYDPFIFESHHRGKLDAPSGTARRLAAIVIESDGSKKHVQEGNPGGAIDAEALHVASVRAGFEPGTHVVGFDGEFDVIRLEHRARGRAVFAVGAVLAAEWLLGQGSAGIHGFEEVLDDLTGTS